MLASVILATVETDFSVSFSSDPLCLQWVSPLIKQILENSTSQNLRIGPFIDTRPETSSKQAHITLAANHLELSVTRGGAYWHVLARTRVPGFKHRYCGKYTTFREGKLSPCWYGDNCSQILTNRQLGLESSWKLLISFKIFADKCPNVFRFYSCV